MGQTQSTDADLPALPQQQIVQVTDEQATSAPASAAGTASAPLRVGTSRQAQAVRPPITLAREGLKLNPQGIVTVEVNAAVDGIVLLYAPAFETYRESDACGTGGTDETTWPSIAEAGRPQRQRRIMRGSCSVRFEQAGEELDNEVWQRPTVEACGDKTRRWPLILILHPGPGSTNVVAANLDPVDGTLMVCCIVEQMQLKVVRQLIAWGGYGAAYVLKEIYGIQEARSASVSGPADSAQDIDSQSACVVCLITPRNTALVPCGHFCVCYECGASIRLSPARARCPLCRKPVHDITQIEVDSVSLGALVSDAATPTVPAEELVQDIAASTELDTANPTRDDTAIIAGVGASGVEVANAGGSGSITASAAEASTIPSMDDVRAARLRALGVTSSTTTTTATATPAAVAVPAGTPAPTVAELAVVGESHGSHQTSIASQATSAADGSSSSAALPPRCLQRLTREMRAIEQQRAENLADHGVELSLFDSEGNDLRAWSLRILTQNIDAACKLGAELRAHDVPAIELEMWIPDGFPMQPPQLRVLRPLFAKGSFFVQDHGALCLEILTKQGWTPAMPLTTLGVQVKAMMSQGRGTVIGRTSQVAPGAEGRETARRVAKRIEALHKDWQHFQDPS